MLKSFKEHFKTSVSFDVLLPSNKNSSAIIDLSKTHYDLSDTCDYTTFVNVGVAMVAIVWTCFFLNIEQIKGSTG